MSGNRRNHPPSKPPAKPPESAADDAARLVVLPKKDELPVKAEPKAKAKVERIGDILRQARTERGEDLYEIAEYLRIKPPFLIALENSRYDELPADAYVIGFLRTYATFLGIEGKDAVDRYRYEMAGRRKKPILAMPIPLSEGRAPTGIVLVGATIAVLLIYALWYGISSANRTDVNAPPPLPAAQQMTPVAPPVSEAAAGLTAPVSSPVSAPAAANPAASATPVIPPAAPGILLQGDQPQPLPPGKDELPAAPAVPAKDVGKEKIKPTAPVTAPQPAKDIAPKDATPPAPVKDDKKQVYGDPAEASRIVIRATQSSWVMVTDSSGKAVFDHVLKPGDTYKVPNQPGLSLTTGNGNGIVLSLNGNDLPKVASGAPHVVRNIPLDPDHLTVEPAQ